MSSGLFGCLLPWGLLLWMIVSIVRFLGGIPGRGGVAIVAVEVVEFVECLGCGEFLGA